MSGITTATALPLLNALLQTLVAPLTFFLTLTLTIATATSTLQVKPSSAGPLRQTALVTRLQLIPTWLFLRAPIPLICTQTGRSSILPCPSRQMVEPSLQTASLSRIQTSLTSPPMQTAEKLQLSRLTQLLPSRPILMHCFKTLAATLSALQLLELQAQPAPTLIPLIQRLQH